MCSDGQYIYCLVPYNITNMQSKIVKIVCEVYELNFRHNLNEYRLSREKSIILYSNSSYDKFIGRRKSIDTSYLINGSIACNGELLVWRSRCKIHVFSLSSGIRLHKELIPNNPWISTYDLTDNYFY